jgi:hypothetical protein
MSGVISISVNNAVNLPSVVRDVGGQQWQQCQVAYPLNGLICNKKTQSMSVEKKIQYDANRIKGAHGKLILQKKKKT